MTETVPVTQTYPDLLATLKARIREARLRAAVSVNRELIMLHWEIGHDILLRQAAEG
jgi:sulfur carrier protein ThiS